MDSTTETNADAAPKQRGVEHWLVLAGSLAPLVLLIVLGLFVEPDARGHGTHEKLGLPPCYPMVRWNVPCPGCGVTTSMTLAAHGEIWNAFVNQPFGLMCAFAAPLLALWGLAHHLRGRDLGARLQALRWGKLALFVLAIATVSWAYKLALVRGWIAIASAGA